MDGRGDAVHKDKVNLEHKCNHCMMLDLIWIGMDCSREEVLSFSLRKIMSGENVYHVSA